ncbi:MAG: hypothetical protein LJE56_02045 [Acidiferrobacterales bacterium]|jgi:hypothetical protein|nr:hypothetical protein [Acidiferrobacterales bacterium]
MMGGYMQVGGFGFLFMLFWAVILIFPFWRISERVGYPGWISLLMLVPGINIIYVYFLALSKWPSEKTKEVS